jgi:hypothetical protein
MEAVRSSESLIQTCKYKGSHNSEHHFGFVTCDIRGSHKCEVVDFGLLGRNFKWTFKQIQVSANLTVSVFKRRYNPGRQYWNSC